MHPKILLGLALGIASALVVLAIAGFLVCEAVGGSKSLPDLHVALLPPDPDAPPGQVRFVARNDGGRTATAVALALLGPGRYAINQR